MHATLHHSAMAGIRKVLRPHARYPTPLGHGRHQEGAPSTCTLPYTTRPCGHQESALSTCTLPYTTRPCGHQESALSTCTLPYTTRPCGHQESALSTCTLPYTTRPWQASGKCSVHMHATLHHSAMAGIRKVLCPHARYPTQLGHGGHQEGVWSTLHDSLDIEAMVGIRRVLCPLEKGPVELYGDGGGRQGRNLQQ